MLVSLLACTALSFQPPAALEREVVVYGGTASGVIAAVTARRLGAEVVLLEPSRHVGGMTTGGLGATDVGNGDAIGGTAREFYRRIRRHYAQPAAWRYQKPSEFRGRGHRAGDDVAWTFEPHVAEQVLRAMLAEAGVDVRTGERLDLSHGVERDGRRIAELRMESGLRVRGRVFIDASYEGDLMALAGVRYRIGREANAEFGETLNGVQTTRARHHQFTAAVDPWRQRGRPESGLLPGLAPRPPGPDGSADHRVQAYCFRLCTTDVPENRRPWPRPDDYDPARYELLLRNFEAGDHRVPCNPVALPNRKTDTNNNTAFSTDLIGGSTDYPDGDYPTRARIVATHESYTRGLLWTLANDPRVPADVRRHFRTWGLAKDEFVDHDNWPPQLYVREARRMIGALVMTEHHCRGTQRVADPIGLGSYGMDSHHVQRYVTATGAVRNEGDVEVHGFAPYGISYRAITPRREQCENLLVPVCVSATHIAFGSIRMEPVFMVLGQSAATAAWLALRGDCAVQDVAYPELRRQLEHDGQVLCWPPPQPSPAALPGIVLDDQSAERSPRWTASTSVRPYVGAGYRHDGNAGKGRRWLRFAVHVAPGDYELRLLLTPHENRASNTPVTVRIGGEERRVQIDERTLPPDRRGASLGRYRLEDGRASVTVGTGGTDGYVVVDGLQLLPRR